MFSVPPVLRLRFVYSSAVRFPPSSSASAGGETWARYTFMGTKPRSAWRLRGRTIEDWDAHQKKKKKITNKDPLAYLRHARIASAQTRARSILNGELFGYFGYERIGHIEKLPPAPAQSSNILHALFVFTRSMVIIDNLKVPRKKNSWRTVAGSDANHTDDLRELHDDALEKVYAHRKRGSPGTGFWYFLCLTRNAPVAKGRSSQGRDEFIPCRLHQEVNPCGATAFRLCSRGGSSSRPHFDSPKDRALRGPRPSPYMFHLDLYAMEIVGSSPD